MKLNPRRPRRCLVSGRHIYNCLKLIPWPCPIPLGLQTHTMSCWPPWVPTPGSRTGRDRQTKGVAGVPSYNHKDPRQSVFHPGPGDTRGTGSSSSLWEELETGPQGAAVSAVYSRGRCWHVQEATGEMLRLPCRRGGRIPGTGTGEGREAKLRKWGSGGGSALPAQHHSTRQPTASGGPLGWVCGLRGKASVEDRKATGDSHLTHLL